ncbi:MAG: anthranilate phosphoribosyltransferase [Alphaproteobacteria bacterium]|nr:anthranilate phosphoribosyltransferase [Alphaproteobacteria bacterium]
MTADMNQLKALIATVADGRSLSQDEARLGFDIMMSGNATPAQMGAFLMALRVRGETVDEITGAARTMRAKVTGIKAPPEAIDVVGTGGDGVGTWNVSTASALVVAGAGVPVAKHGNRAFSSKAGSADVLLALGVNLDCDLKLVEKAIAEARVGFMMAPRHHSAMRHVGGTRVELGTRTIFNILGPLSNPAGVRRLLVGVFARKWIEPMARTLGNLGAEHAWVVHGSEGLDEITTTGPTAVAEFKDGNVRTFEIKPEDAGLKPARLEELKGGTPQENAQAVRDLLDGKKSAFRDIVCLNAGAALIVAGKAKDIRDGAGQAASSIDGGKAKTALQQLVAITNTPPSLAAPAE